MRDYAELIKDLRESAEWADRLAVLMGRDVGDAKAPLMRKAADAIEDLLAAVPHWISVEERLPEESGYTIVFCADGERRHVTFAKYQKTPKRWELTGARSYWRVLRWMSLPKPPKEDAE